MIVEMRSTGGVSKQQSELTEDESKAVSDAINIFEELFPRRKKLVIDLDFIVPLIKILRIEEE